MSGPRVGILISGGGSNMGALIAAMQGGAVAASPALVLSNRADAAGLARAAAAGVATAVVDHRDFADRAGFEAALDRVLRQAGVDLVCCAGFLRVLTAQMTTAWAGRMLNIHPALLPLFKGLDTHARALAAGVAVHGATVHEVTAELDGGPILGQVVVPVRGGDTPESLAARVLAAEHRLYPAVLAAFVRDPVALRRDRIALWGM